MKYRVNVVRYECVGVDYNQMAQDTDQWPAHANIVTDFLVS
jgi:hypothetical protein